MYKIGFLTARKTINGKILREFFEEKNYISSKHSDFGYEWEIHPAYRWALQPTGIMNIIDNIDVCYQDN
jgi:hypothetical protein